MRAVPAGHPWRACSAGAVPDCCDGLRWRHATRGLHTSASTAWTGAADVDGRDNLDRSVAPPQFPQLGAVVAAPYFPHDSVTGFVSLIQHSLEFVHTSTGLPWWLTFCSAAVGLRLALFPTTVYSLRNAARLAKAGPDVLRVNDAYRKGTEALGPSPSIAQRRAKISQ